VSQGFRYRQEDGFWEVLIYLQPVELIGGAEDAEIVSPGFSLDLDGLRGVFDQVHDFAWLAVGLNYDEGPRVSIEGTYKGHEVFVQVLAYAPEDEGPRMKVDTRQHDR
jgi:hypothetical protein